MWNIYKMILNRFHYGIAVIEIWRIDMKTTKYAGMTDHEVLEGRYLSGRRDLVRNRFPKSLVAWFNY
jgi:hypothetical protein